MVNYLEIEFGVNNTSNDCPRASAILHATALQGGSNKQAVLDTIQNADLRAIFRASENLSDDDLLKIRKVIESLYPDAFKN